ncbi:hypothetical protein HAX54_039639 [Datura stramonium]|uniref:Uncharacterized protein n=1 Tax=Datura stramonium TaxID=4076 RepID=A0ABS8VN24_DATST|nr:hypothetical protein [Datura stramonium]
MVHITYLPFSTANSRNQANRVLTIWEDEPTSQRMVYQLKNGLELGRKGFLKYGARYGPSFPKMVHISMDDKLLVPGHDDTPIIYFNEASESREEDPSTSYSSITTRSGKVVHLKP